MWKGTGMVSEIASRTIIRNLSRIDHFLRKRGIESRNKCRITLLGKCKTERESELVSNVPKLDF